jgi:hypothetical protein
MGYVSLSQKAMNYGSIIIPVFAEALSLESTNLGLHENIMGVVKNMFLCFQQIFHINRPTNKLLLMLHCWNLKDAVLNGELFETQVVPFPTATR